MAFTQDNVQGVEGLFRPLGDRGAGPFTQNQAQGYEKGFLILLDDSQLQAQEAEVEPSPVVVVASIPTPTISAQRHIEVTPDTVSAVAEIKQPGIYILQATYPDEVLADFKPAIHLGDGNYKVL